MTGLLDGTQIPWHFVSGRHEPGTTVDPLVLARVQARRAATALPPPVVRELQPSKRLVAGGLFVAGALAAHWRRGRS